MRHWKPPCSRTINPSNKIRLRRGPISNSSSHTLSLKMKFSTIILALVVGVIATPINPESTVTLNFLSRDLYVFGMLTMLSATGNEDSASSSKLSRRKLDLSVTDRTQNSVHSDGLSWYKRDSVMDDHNQGSASPDGLSWY